MSDLKSSITGIPETTEAIHNSSYNIETSRGDTHISDDLKMIVVEALDRNMDIDDSNIKVSVTPQNWIVLTGTVPREEMIKEIELCIRELGHVEIDNQLKISPQSS
jgi:osmotically-inducible protein OsmY